MARPLIPRWLAPRGRSSLGTAFLWLPVSLAMGCGDDTPSTPPPVVVIGAASEHASATGFDEYAGTCCDEPVITAVVDAHIALATALAADDGPAATAEVAAFKAAVEAALGAGAGVTEADRTHLSSLSDLGGRMVALGADLEGLRAELGDTVDPLFTLVAAHGGGEGKLAVAYCPMATPPGRWLQRTEPLANPYYGAEMLRCGVFESLADAGYPGG